MGRCHCAGCFKVANTWTFRPTRALRAALLSPVHHLFPAFRKEPQISVIIYIRSQQDALRSFPCVGDQKVQALRSLSLTCQVLGEADWSHCRVWGMVSLTAKSRTKAETVGTGVPWIRISHKQVHLWWKRMNIQELSTWYFLKVGHWQILSVLLAADRNRITPFSRFCRYSRSFTCLSRMIASLWSGRNADRLHPGPSALTTLHASEGMRT